MRTHYLSFYIFDNIFFIIAFAAILKNTIFKNVPVIFQRFIEATFHLHWFYLPNPLRNLEGDWKVALTEISVPEIFHNVDKASG